jgi:subtilisin
MSNHVSEQLSSTGVAQVIAVLKEPPPAAGAGKPSAALAASIPVTESRTMAAASEDIVTALAKCFRTSERSTDAAVATAMAARKESSPGVRWFNKAAEPSDPTPPVRYFPNLGMMLGTVDKKGFDELAAHARVKKVVAPPVPSLIRPVRVAPVKPSAAAAAQLTWGIKRLQANKLHKLGWTGAGVIVGQLDTGADGKHPALKNAFHAFAEFDDLGFEVTPTPAPHDTDDHGTHTAGTIAGRATAGRAIGVAPDALLASAIVIEGGNVIARILAGMDWVIGQGAKILNMSLGLRGFFDDFLPITQRLRERGILPIFAVGNEGPGTSRSPGNYAEALSVGAMDQRDRVAGFSSSQEFIRPNDAVVPDLVAPGVAVVSAMSGGGFQEMDGSSMATTRTSPASPLCCCRRLLTRPSIRSKEPSSIPVHCLKENYPNGRIAVSPMRSRHCNCWASLRGWSWPPRSSPRNQDVPRSLLPPSAPRRLRSSNGSRKPDRAEPPADANRSGKLLRDSDAQHAGGWLDHPVWALLVSTREVRCHCRKGQSGIARSARGGWFRPGPGRVSTAGHWRGKAIL